MYWCQYIVCDSAIVLQRFYLINIQNGVKCLLCKVYSLNTPKIIWFQFF